MEIRWMIRRDLPEVMAIENASFDRPLPEAELVNTLRSRNSIGMVVEDGDKVLGFMIYLLHKTSLEILNFAVHPDYRRQGIATLMIDKLISKLSKQRRERILIAVNEHFSDAHKFFSSVGFRAIGTIIVEGETFYTFEWEVLVKSFPKNRIAKFMQELLTESEGDL